VPSPMLTTIRIPIGITSPLHLRALAERP
jgi:hypothetical protein